MRCNLWHEIKSPRLIAIEQTAYSFVSKASSPSLIFLILNTLYIRDLSRAVKIVLGDGHDGDGALNDKPTAIIQGRQHQPRDPQRGRHSQRPICTKLRRFVTSAAFLGSARRPNASAEPLGVTYRSCTLCAHSQHHRGGDWRRFRCNSSGHFCAQRHPHSRYKRSSHRRIFVVSRLA